MKNIIMCFVMLYSVVIIKAQTLTIKSAETNEPLEMVTVSTLKPNISVTTNKDGQADITQFKGAPTIEIRMLGFETTKISYQKLKDKNFQLLLQTSSFDIGGVVVSVSKWEQNMADVPVKIEKIDMKEAALQNPQTSADLLGSSGKVFIQKSQQGGGSPMIRGFATNRLVYTVDGVRMNTAIFRGGNIQNVINLDNFSTESLEVLFGPGSVMYGSDAIGGVMAFKTLTPELSTDVKPNINGSALFRFASANTEKTGHFDINVGFKKWAMLTSISYSDFDDLRQGSKGPDEYLKPFHVERIDSLDVVVSQKDKLLQVPTAYSQLNMMQKIRYKPTEFLDIQYGFHYSTTSPYGRYDRHNRMRNGLPRYAEWDYGPQKWMMNMLSLGYSKTNIAFDQLAFRFAHQLFEESRIDRSFNKNDRTNNAEKVNAYSVNLDLIKNIKKKHTLFYGFEYVFDKVKSTGEITNISTNVTINSPARYPNSSWQSVGLYVSDEYRVLPKLTLTSGLRYSHVKIDADFDTTFYPFPFTEAKISKGALSGSFGLAYKPMSDFVLQANFGTGFRAPNVDDMGKVFDSEPGAVTVPNLDLKPEYAYNVDVGLTKIFADRIKVEFTAYYTQLKNAMVRRNYTLNGADSIIYQGELSQVQAIQNAASAYVWGVQAGVEIKLPLNFYIYSDVNIQRGKEELDNGDLSPLRHAAPWFGVSRLKYNYKNLVLELNAQYSGGLFNDQLAEEEKAKTEIYALDDVGRAYSPGWYTLNFKGSYQVNKYLLISAGIENIADTRYRTYSSGVSAAGRNFILSAKAMF